MKILEVKNISKSFGDNLIISDINMYLKKGEIISLLGSSGVGKTTLFNIIAGVSKPDTGKILYDSKDITFETGHISYMLQKDLLLEHKTILDNVSMPLYLNKTNKKEAYDIALKYFNIFGIDGYEYKYPNQLSGGMRQRAALLRTYLFSRDIALLDEPFSALDMITKRHMHLWYLNVMKEIKLSTIFITHDIDEALFLSDRIYIMAGKPGKIIKEIDIDNKEKSGEEFLLNDYFVNKKRKILELLK